MDIGRTLLGSEAVEQCAPEELADREGPCVDGGDGADLCSRQAEFPLHTGVDDGVTSLEAEQEHDEGDGERPHPPAHGATGLMFSMIADGT